MIISTFSHQIQDMHLHCAYNSLPIKKGPTSKINQDLIFLSFSFPLVHLSYNQLGTTSHRYIVESGLVTLENYHIQLQSKKYKTKNTIQKTTNSRIKIIILSVQAMNKGMSSLGLAFYTTDNVSQIDRIIVLHKAVNSKKCSNESLQYKFGFKP